MSVPKSTTKVKKDGCVEFSYMSNCDRIQYTIRELTRGALRDVGKYLKKQYNINFYNQLKKHSGLAGKNANYWARSKECDLQIGLNKLKGKKKAGFWASFYETGSSKTPKLDILRNTVYSERDMIEKIESQYLSELNKSNPSLDGLSEGDYESEE